MVELVRKLTRGTASVSATVALLEQLGYRGRWIRYKGLEEMRGDVDRDGNALFISVGRADRPGHSVHATPDA
jgi:hypothetical protein